jgi:hypothetical protein
VRCPAKFWATARLKVVRERDDLELPTAFDDAPEKPNVLVADSQAAVVQDEVSRPHAWMRSDDAGRRARIDPALLRGSATASLGLDLARSGLTNNRWRTMSGSRNTNATVARGSAPIRRRRGATAPDRAPRRLSVKRDGEPGLHEPLGPRVITPLSTDAGRVARTDEVIADASQRLRADASTCRTRSSRP